MSLYHIYLNINYSVCTQWHSQNAELRTSKGDYWDKKWFSSIASLFKMELLLKKEFAPRGSQFFPLKSSSFWYGRSLLSHQVTSLECFYYFFFAHMRNCLMGATPMVHIQHSQSPNKSSSVVIPKSANRNKSCLPFSSAEMFKKPLWQTVWTQIRLCSGSTLFASILNSSVMLGNYLQQTTSADVIFQIIFFLAL